MEKKNNNSVLIILLIILILGVGGLAYLYLDISNKLEDTSLQKELIEERKVELEQELTDMYYEYDGLMSENDSMNTKMGEQQEKINRLLAISSSNAEKIRLYKKELGTLRDVMKSYIIQIDSLNRRNQVLVAENVQVRNTLRKTERIKTGLEKDKKELTQKVKTASILHAKNIIISPLNKSSKLKYKAAKVAKLKACFTIRENNVVEAGSKTVYLRVVRPDDIALSNPDASTINISDEAIVYSASRVLEFENSDIDMCIFWDNDGQLISGTYTVFLYENEVLIGNSSFALK